MTHSGGMPGMGGGMGGGMPGLGGMDPGMLVNFVIRPPKSTYQELPEGPVDFR